MDRFVVLDPTHDMDAVRETARIIKKAGGAGAEVIAALTYTMSAAHDDAFYAGHRGSSTRTARTSTGRTSRTPPGSSPRTGRGR